MSKDNLFDEYQPDDLADPKLTTVRRAKKRKPFKAEFVMLPVRWIEALRRAKSTAAAYELAHTLLVEAFKREYIGGEIVLSASVTDMPQTTRVRAAKELAKLGLIKLHQQGGQARRVSLGRQARRISLWRRRR
jgi:hypothetical protein